MQTDTTSSKPDQAAPASVLCALADSAMNGLNGLLSIQTALAQQWLDSICRQQKSKSLALEHWLQSRTEALQDSLEYGVHLSKDWYIATTHAQADWLQVSERLICEANRNMQQAMHNIAPRAALPAAAFEPVCRVMNMGSYAFESMAKATRQVTSFAGTNLGNAAIHAARIAREEYSARHHSGNRHH